MKALNIGIQNYISDLHEKFEVCLKNISTANCLRMINDEFNTIIFI